MSELKVRRSGLVSFTIRLGSTITGLAFVVIVTSNLSQADFGLWLLISKVLAYMVFVTNILSFWTTRYRARSITLGKTIIVGAFIFSLVLIPAYLVISYGVANIVGQASSLAPNFYYFLVALPQVPLYIFLAVIEAILWGSRPAKASLGFAFFEVAKVIIGFVTVGILHLSLTGAILAVMFAQIVQLVVSLALTKNEYKDKASLSMIGTMVRTGWVAMLNSLQPIVISFDFIIVGSLTASTLPLAVYGVALTLASVISYSGFMATGLYASLLSGKDPRHSIRQVLELQLLFLFPMTVGEIVIAGPLMHLLNKAYESGALILVVLAIAQALMALSTTIDNVISGTDTTDASGKADFASYLRSKMFFISKVNISVGVAYLLAVSTASVLFNRGLPSIFGLSSYNLLGILWAICSLSMFVVIILLKMKQVRKVAENVIPWKTIPAMLVSTAVFSAVLYVLSKYFTPAGGEISQAAGILILEGVSLATYFAIVLTLSKTFRGLAKAAIYSIREELS